jgi:hypothetical protein
MNSLKKYAIKAITGFSHPGKKAVPAMTEYATKILEIGEMFTLGKLVSVFKFISEWIRAFTVRR